MNLGLQLHHHVRHSKFVLVIEGEDVREEFDSLEAAMNSAAMIVNGTIPLIQLDGEGTVILESTIETEPFRRQLMGEPDSICG